MTILSNLIEKKDIVLYLRFRIKRLKETSDNEMKVYPKEDRQRLYKIFEVRRSELDRLLQLILENKLKDDCKKMWNHFEANKTKLKGGKK